MLCCDLSLMLCHSKATSSISSITSSLPFTYSTSFLGTPILEYVLNAIRFSVTGTPILEFYPQSFYQPANLILVVFYQPNINEKKRTKYLRWKFRRVRKMNELVACHSSDPLSSQSRNTRKSFVPSRKVLRICPLPTCFHTDLNCWSQISITVPRHNTAPYYESIQQFKKHKIRNGEAKPQTTSKTYIVKNLQP